MRLRTIPPGSLPTGHGRVRLDALGLLFISLHTLPTPKQYSRRSPKIPRVQDRMHAARRMVDPATAAAYSPLPYCLVKKGSQTGAE